MWEQKTDYSEVKKKKKIPEIVKEYILRKQDKRWKSKSENVENFIKKSGGKEKESIENWINGLLWNGKERICGRTRTEIEKN